MAFAGGALVFPGGRIDPADREMAANEGEAAAIAAIRECVEETAVPIGLSPVPTPDAALQMQSELLAEENLAPVLKRHRSQLEIAALVPFARWVPKFHATRRFDTLFFLARSPGPDWSPNVVERECAAALWISAAEALDRDRRGELRLIFPTRRNLERLAKHDSFELMKDDADAHPIEPISPWVEEIDGESFITIPEGIGYPVTRERLDGLWRG